MSDLDRTIELLRNRITEMLLGGVSVSDVINAALGDMTMDIYCNLFYKKDIERITHPYRRDYGHYFCNNPVIKSDFCVRKNNVDTLNF